MKGDILELMAERRKVRSKVSQEYKKIDQEVKIKCKEAKEKWINVKCSEIEKTKRSDPRTTHKQIKELTGARACSSTGCIKSKEGTIIVEKEKILERWAEYIDDLFNDDRIEQPLILKNMDGPKILKSEVKSSLYKLKSNKAAGPDEVVTEMLIALEDYGIDKLTDIVNEIYDTGVIPEELSRSIFIALPKRPGATECELHRTISLMSHMTKLILRKIMTRARSRLGQK